MKSIGLDFGAGYFKGVVLDESNSIIHSYYTKYAGQPLEESAKFIEKVDELFPDEKFCIGITSLNSVKKIEKSIFMESELSSAIKMGTQKEDACAGISYAIARNYLEKVAGKKKIGSRIVFQGGVASNMAVLSAFKNILGKDIIAHPYR